MSRPLAAGIGGASLATVLVYLWFQVQHWVIRGSAYTDLPGQDSLGLVLKIQLYALVVIALGVGRVCGALSQDRRWMAVLLGVSPLLVLTAVSSKNYWYLYVLFPCV